MNIAFGKCTNKYIIIIYTKQEGIDLCESEK